MGEQESSQVPPATGHDGSIELLGGFRYVARQPILDLNGKVHGYELLYRDGPELAFRGDGEFATRTILDNSVIFGVEKFAGGSNAFINCTFETLTQDQVTVLPPGVTVLEVLETVEPTLELIEACRKLKTLGFRLALDDFIWAPKFAPLVELADYIKVDFMLTDAAGRKDLFGRLKGRKVALLAEKIETQEEYQHACAEGFTLFQGYYFCRPILMKNCKIPSNHLAQFEILRLMHDNPVDLFKLSEAVKRDESLTYRILRMVNSAGYATRVEVDSVRSALVILGEVTFRRIIMLAIATELNSGRPSEILRMAAVRARFCELVAGLCSLSTAEQYLLGMLSLLPAMLRIPMDELTPALPIRKELREALEGRDVPEGRMLAWLRGHECGDWAACDAIVQLSGLRKAQVEEFYVESVLWADNQFLMAK